MTTTTITVKSARKAVLDRIATLRVLDNSHAAIDVRGMCLSLLADDLDRLVAAATAEGAREELSRMQALADEAERLGHA